MDVAVVVFAERLLPPEPELDSAGSSGTRELAGACKQPVRVLLLKGNRLGCPLIASNLEMSEWYQLKYPI